MNVVPRLVEHRAASAANACNAVPSTSPVNTKEVLIGAAIPVKRYEDGEKEVRLESLEVRR